MKRGGELLIAGYAAMDLIVYLPTLPKPDERISVFKIEQSPGGMAANCACAAGRLGAKVQFFGVLGEDEYGSKIIKDFELYKVGTSCIKIDPESQTNCCIIMVLPSGERTIISEHLKFDYRPLQSYLDSPAIKEASILHLDGYRLSDCFTTVQLAHEKGLLVSADLDGFNPASVNEAKDMLHCLDIVFMNKDLMNNLFKEKEPEKLFDSIKDSKPDMIIITLGKDGAYLLSKEYIKKVSGIQTKVYDTIGAGDVFAGAFLSEYVQTENCGWSLEFANAAAALSVSGKGARGFLPSKEQVLLLLKRKY